MLFESMHVGLCVIEVIFDEQGRSTDHRFLEVNPAFERQTGIKDAKNRLMREIAPNHEQHWFDFYGHIALTGETMRVENHPAALNRWCDVCAFRVGLPELRRVGIVFKDITERKRAEAERELLLKEAQDARNQAEAANRMKDEFLATLSHELRTPLNALLGWAKMIRSGKLDAADIQEGAEVIERNSRSQAQLIEDLLDISRIISGKMTLDVQRVNIQDVIDAAVTAVVPAAEAKGVRIQKILDSLAGPVAGDPTRIQQIVWNLLSNAVKFTLKGGKVQVLLERVNSHVEISVIDTGIGISPEFLPYVFERFRQADGSTTRRHGGLGLGLSIVKQMVEMHGGTVRATSPGEGQGATFTVTLPITTVHPEKVTPKEPDRKEIACEDGLLAGVSVLVVDDEHDARDLIRRILADCHAAVFLAGSAGEALEHIGRSNPDVRVAGKRPCHSHKLRVNRFLTVTVGEARVSSYL